MYIFFSDSISTTSTPTPTQVLPTIAASSSQGKKKKAAETSLDSYFIRSTPMQKKSLDKQVARFIFATNTAFRSVEHPQFVRLMQQLRPGYTPPNRKEISGPLLETIYEEEKKTCSLILKNQSVCLGFDGWSNVHNEPIICLTVTTKTGDVYLVDTIDTSGHAHTASYLTEVAVNSIKKCEEDLNCKVRSVVTDNAANVAKMRLQLEGYENLDVITYGCSAHVLNLLANDFQFLNVKEHILNVIKYFRNNHFANACYRKSGAPKLVLPSEVRWNTMVDCLETYLKGWPTLLQICEEHRDTIDKTVQTQVSNFVLKRNVEDMVMRLKPISIALDEVQRNNCTISESVRVWKNLQIEIETKKDRHVTQKFKNRYNMALTPAHFLAYMLDPKEKNSALELTEEEKKAAFDFAKSKYSSSSLLPLIVKFQSKISSPFQESLFENEVTSQVTAYEWWKSQKNDIDKYNDKVFLIIEQLLTAQASSASVERIFSSFGLVHSKLRNRLGTEKASKLVFLFKVFNSGVKT